jgi:hypothetical protein
MLQPIRYLDNILGNKRESLELLKAFNFWSKVPKDKFAIIERTIEMTLSYSLL